MIEKFLTKCIPFLVNIFELMGVSIVSVGAFTAFYFYVKKIFLKDNVSIKHQFAMSMATGLEFKLAAEILKTVLVKTFHELIILGAVFILRVLMTFVIEWEIKQDNNQKNKTN